MSFFYVGLQTEMMIQMIDLHAQDKSSKLRMSTMAIFSILLLFVFDTQGDELRPARSHPAAVTVVMTDELGPVYADEQGHTLYTWHGDTLHNQSNCNNDRYLDRILGQGDNPTYLPDAKTRLTCEQVWPPLEANSEDVPLGKWSPISRHDGTHQWAYNGKPVYRSIYDRQPGAMVGVGGNFHGGTLKERSPLFAEPDVPLGMSGRTTDLGYVLTTDAGLTLYTVPRSVVGPECRDACNISFLPLRASALTRLTEDSRWQVIEHPDGYFQWAIDGELLFTYAGDRKSGDVNGITIEGVSAVVFTPRATTPPEISIQMSSEGEVYANQDGLTLYTFYCQDEAPDELPCNQPGSSEVYRLGLCGTPEECLQTWRPVAAPTGAKSIGNVWTVVGIDPTGKHQFLPSGSSEKPLRVWAYYGKPVYSYVGDSAPGDIVGHGIRSLRHWGYYMLKRNGFFE